MKNSRVDLIEVDVTDSGRAKGGFTRGRVAIFAGGRHGACVLKFMALTLVLLVAGTACRPQEEPQDTLRDAEDAKTERTVTIYRTDEAGIQTDCGAVVSEDWALPEPPPTDLASAAIREVLRDVLPAAGLHPPGTLPLLDYFRGVVIRDGVAILAFEGDALRYLNNAACAQMAVKAPMVRTLLAFPDVSTVEFEIDGQIYRDWDA
ncbi:MAG: GerMN domain-containing protein [Rhodothermales bacterium]|nr:GerMN domain-containing protein [Rhodothermales bacterium]